MSDQAREARARARGARMSIVRGDNNGTPLRGREAFALAARLSTEQWLLAGKSLPGYLRAQMPIVRVPPEPE